MIHRPHFLTSYFLVESIFLLVNCAVWSRLSEFLVQSDPLGDLLLLRWNHSHIRGRHTFFFFLK